MSDYKSKRIEYINNWPTMPRFDIELQYEEKYKKTNNGTPFIPFPMKSNSDEFFNKAISFMIDAIECLCNKPNHSFDFIFTALDLYSKHIVRVDRITDRIRDLVPLLSNLINENIDLKKEFTNLIKNIPNKSLQYLFKQLYDTRVNRRISTVNNTRTNLGNIVNSITASYSNDFNNYSTGIRPGSRLLRHVLTKEDITISSNHYNVSLDDKLHLLASGLLYSLRNDAYHGGSISCTKSSFCNMSTMANSYFSFMLTYYLLLLLIIDNTSANKQNDLSALANNINLNTSCYVSLFGKHNIGR